MKNYEDDKLLARAKQIAVTLVVAAVILFLALSNSVFNYSKTHAFQYEVNYRNLSAPGQSVVSTMKKAGELQSIVLSGNNRKSSGSGTFFDEVTRIHGK